jgi:hypothetical protein
VTGYLPPIAAAILLSLVYALRGSAGEDRLTARFWARRRWISAAAGVSVAYVFVDVLPELGELGATLHEHGGGIGALFGEQRIYVLTLLSFLLMYGLQHIVLEAREVRAGGGGHGERDAIYWLHLIGYAAYSALIGYLLPERAEQGAKVLAFYTAAMAIHFVIVNHSLAESHEDVYRHHGRWWLAASVLAGVAIGLTVPISETWFARLFAILAGGVVITSLRAELPDHDRGRFWPFCLAALGYAVLLLAA